jgi:histidinol-phosphate aminotransferase
MSQEESKIIRPEIAGLQPYVSPNFDWKVKLDLNESPYDFPVEIKREVLERVHKLQWQRYHDEFEQPLYEQIAEYENHDPDGVLIGNGSNELIFHSLLSVIRHGDSVVIPEPTFSLYRQNVTVLGGTPEMVRLRDGDFSLATRALLDRAGETNARAILICSPNNPTANLIPNAEIEQVCREFSGLVIVDEAYAQFADGNAFALLESCPNLVLLRTFSKAFGMAGLRFGILLASPMLAREIGKVQLPHHVGFFTQVAAGTILSHPKIIVERVKALKAEREKLSGQLSEIEGINPLPSQANFVLIECGGLDANKVFEQLLGRGVLVRNVTGYPGLARYLRITVGTPEENAALLVALREVMG